MLIVAIHSPISPSPCLAPYSFAGWQVLTLAGSTPGWADAIGSSALFNQPAGIAIDASGNVLIAEVQNNRIRKILSTGITFNFAGSGVSAYVDGGGSAASFLGVKDVFLSTTGLLYVSDNLGNRIRIVSSSGVVTTLAGTGSETSIDGSATSASFKRPKGLFADTGGVLFVVDSQHKIRKISTSGEVTTFAGTGIAAYVDGFGTSARFRDPAALCVDSCGNVFVTDYNNNRIRKITSSGMVSTFAGSGTTDGNDGVGQSASIYLPRGIVQDTVGNLFITEVGLNRIRMITTSGAVTTIAGSGTAMWGDGTGTAASFNYPLCLALDTMGNLYVSELSNNRVRVIYSKGLYFIVHTWVTVAY